MTFVNTAHQTSATPVNNKNRARTVRVVVLHTANRAVLSRALPVLRRRTPDALLPAHACSRAVLEIRAPVRYAARTAPDPTHLDADAGRAGKVDHTRDRVQPERPVPARGELGRYGRILRRGRVETPVRELYRARKQAERRREREVQRGFREKAPREDGEDPLRSTESVSFTRLALGARGTYRSSS